MSYKQQAYYTPQQHCTRDERYSQITDLLASQGRGVKLSTKQIAKYIGMAKSPHVSNLLADLCFQNRITWEWSVTHNGLKVRVFFIDVEGDYNG